MSDKPESQSARLFRVTMHGECLLRADDMWRTEEDRVDEWGDSGNLLPLIPSNPTAKAAATDIAGIFADPTSLVDAWMLPLCVSVDGVRIEFASDKESEFNIPTDVAGAGVPPEQSIENRVLYERQERVRAEARLAAVERAWQSMRAAWRAGDDLAAHAVVLDGLFE